MGCGQNELVLHDVEIKQISRFGTYPGDDVDSCFKYDGRNDCVERFRALFDVVRLRFQNIGQNHENVVTSLLGDGQPLDLVKIFWAVWNRGGCDNVSAYGLWGSVAVECKIDCSISEEYIKTVYMKYISELDQSFRMIINTKWLENGNEDEKIGLLMSKLHEEFLGFLERENGEYEKMGPLMSKLHEEFLGFLEREKGKIVVFEQESGCMYNDVDILELNEVCDIAEKSRKTSNDSKKRKRDSNSLSSMVRWVVEVAKCPDYVAIRRIPEDLRTQVLLARRMLSKFSTTEYSQKRLKIGPSMYEDGTSQFIGKLRSTERINFVTKPCNSPCCNSLLTIHKNVISPLELENYPKEQANHEVQIFETYEEVKSQKSTCVGSYFQAQVPEWTGLVTKSDMKWLGTKMWPPENGLQIINFEKNPIKNSRKQSCECLFPNSVACIRFHIAENRMKLKREIGPLFYKWNFNGMGEEVSLSWTIEEEKRFKLTVTERLNLTNPSTCFWDDIATFFPDKSREKLVSYYFNVFLIGRRAYQNRVSPKDVGSDDDDEDESAFGCVGGRFGSEALGVGVSLRQSLR